MSLSNKVYVVGERDRLLVAGKTHETAHETIRCSTLKFQFQNQQVNSSRTQAIAMMCV